MNECESKPCQQKCQNAPGSYKCYCEPGYKKTVEDPKDARCSGKWAFSEVKVNESCKQCCFSFCEIESLALLFFAFTW